MSRLDVDGIPIVITHGTPDVKVQPSMEAYFVLANYLFYVDAPALPPDDLVAIVEDLVRAYRAPLEQQPPPPAASERAGGKAQ